MNESSQDTFHAGEQAYDSYIPLWVSEEEEEEY